MSIKENSVRMLGTEAHITTPGVAIRIRMPGLLGTAPHITNPINNACMHNYIYNNLLFIPTPTTPEILSRE